MALNGVWSASLGKGSPSHLVQSCPILGVGAHPHFQATEPAFVCRQFSVVTWPVQLDMEHCYLPTVVVPIYLLAFLHAFELLGWKQLGQPTGAHSIVWI